MSIADEALAFRIWQVCHPIGWDCTMSEAGEAVNATAQKVGHIARQKGWKSRFRTTATDLNAHRIAEVSH